MSNINEGNELQELNDIGIKVRSQTQENLEKEALEHLNNLSKNLKNDVEDGEIIEEESSKKPLVETSKIKALEFNVESYIQSQKLMKNRTKKEKLISKYGLLPEKSNKTIVKNKFCNKSTSKISLVDQNSIIFKNNKAKKKKRKCQSFEDDSHSEYMPSDEEYESSNHQKKKLKTKIESEDNCSDSEYVPSEDEESAEHTRKKSKKKILLKKCNKQQIKDDGNIQFYKKRLKKFENLIDEKVKNLDYGIQVPRSIWDRLYDFQKFGVKWLNNLNEQRVGGLLGDEMGLGKTIQLIVFLAALDYSKKISYFGSFKGLGPTLIVCPATVLNQWVQHFHEWYPKFRVAILHQSGSYKGDFFRLVREINTNKQILITTYSSVLKYQSVLLNLSWHYVILDEGHKIRNPSAKITLTIKKIKTPHRIILSGSPMQNNYNELWSLFDFLNPGKLGTLETFQNHFAHPIMQGEFANATPMQEALSGTLAMALKDILTRYMLYRTKDDVQCTINLPNKSEQVLFCDLAPEQRELYQEILKSEDVRSIIDRGKQTFFVKQGRATVFRAINTLRKICNHPDIYLQEFNSEEFETLLDKNDIPIEKTFGYYKKSGKMIVVAALLKIWLKQNHRVLLFTQSRQMIQIFELFLTMQDYKYVKMDGSTNIAFRQPLIDKFNNDSSYFVFLLTTRVGGLGINLTGADRVIIFDPDWNPATDTQARERAWRIGQDKNVTIYRLLLSGTIEEKIYQRQIWKHLLSNKVLIDPKQKKIFKTSDLYELFSLGEPKSENETVKLFKESKIDIGKETQPKKEKLNGPKSLGSNSKEIKKNEQKIDPIVKRKLLAQQKLKLSSAETNERNKFDEIETNLSFNDILKEFEKHDLKPNVMVDESPKNSSINPIRSNFDLDPGEKCKLSQQQNIQTPSSGELFEIDEKKIDNCYKIKKNKSLDCDKNSESNNSILESILLKDNEKSVNRNKHSEKKTKIDTSGAIDGELVEGLLKREKTKSKDKIKISTRSQDEYVLNKLFSKGVQNALKHDSIVQRKKYESNSLKIRSEVEKKAEMALEALKQSESQ